MPDIPPISDPNPTPSPIEAGERPKRGLSPEARAWMGLEAADFPIYAAMSGAAALFWIVNPPIELLISLVCLGLGVFSCVTGTKPRPELSRLTNALKLVGYPIGMLVVAYFIAVNFLLWNPKPQTPFFPHWSQFR